MAKPSYCCFRGWSVHPGQFCAKSVEYGGCRGLESRSRLDYLGQTVRRSGCEISVNVHHSKKLEPLGAPSRINRKILEVWQEFTPYRCAEPPRMVTEHRHVDSIAHDCSYRPLLAVTLELLVSEPGV